MSSETLTTSPSPKRKSLSLPPSPSPSFKRAFRSAIPNTKRHVDPSNHGNDKCDWFWTLCNAIGLAVALILQGSFINFFLINYNDATAEWYFLFFADFVVLVTFMFSLTYAWRFYNRLKRHGMRIGSSISAHRHEQQSEPLASSSAAGPSTPRIGHGIFKFSFPKPMGLLPLIYICWILYSLNVLIKVGLLYSTETPEKMIQAGIKDSKERILLSLAGSIPVFLFWVESHWTLSDKRHRRLSKPAVDDLICHTALELFDSLTFLDLITPDDQRELERDHKMISLAMKCMIVAFACVNFVLPTLGLYRLSRTHFGEKTNGMIRVIDEHTGQPTTRGLGISILYHFLRLVAVNIPYLVIRIIISQDPEKELSIFVVKNALGIWVSLRNLIPEIKQWFRIRNYKKEARLRGNIPLRVKIDASNFDPTRGWERHLGRLSAPSSPN